MNIAVVGSSGYIAGFLLKRLNSEAHVDRILKIDQTTAADVYLNLQEPYKFNYDCLDGIDYIIFTAAISGPDQCAADFSFCWNINVTGTRYFIAQAIKRKCRVVFFSSDAVFGDIPGKIYDEYSATEAKTPYGRMKKAVEDEFNNSAYFKAIRLSYVVSEKDRFMSYCLSCIKSGEAAEVFHPFYRNVIVVDDVIDVVLWLSLHWGEYRPFALNVAGDELVSRVRIADEINRVLENRLKYKISVPNETFYKNRPPITQMKSLYLQPYEIVKNGSFTEKIRDTLINIML